MGENGRNREREQALLALFERAGCVRAEPAVLQPAEPFIDLSGEDLRRRMFITTDHAGREYCLRPEFTIPVCRDHIAKKSNAPITYGYLGTVFRQRSGAPSEFLQAGIEMLGRPDHTAADAELVALSLEAAAAYGIASPEIVMGDVGLFSALLEAMHLPKTWKRRLSKDFNRARSFADDLEKLADEEAHQAGASLPAGLVAALKSDNADQARAFVKDVLTIAGISNLGGRSTAEIAERFVEQAGDGATPLPKETVATIRRFLALSGDPDQVAAGLRALAAETGLALEPAIARLEERIGFLAARGVDVAEIRFSTGFGRGLDYYTGLVFELRDRGRRVEGQLVAGGRYDGLLAMLGGSKDEPAVGCAFWLERMNQAGDA